MIAFWEWSEVEKGLMKSLSESQKDEMRSLEPLLSPTDAADLRWIRFEDRLHTYLVSDLQRRLREIADTAFENWSRLVYGEQFRSDLARLGSHSLMERRMRACFEFEILKREKHEAERQGSKQSDDEMKKQVTDLAARVDELEEQMDESRAIALDRLQPELQQLSQLSRQAHSIESHAMKNLHDLSEIHSFTFSKCKRLEGRLEQLEETTSKLANAWQQQSPSAQGPRSHTMEI